MNRLTLQDALALQGHLIDRASRDGLKPVAIAIVDAHGNLICSATMDGTKTPSIVTAHNKAVTAVKFERDTIEFHHIRKGSKWLEDPIGGWTEIDVANAMHINPWFVSWGGGALIVAEDGTVLGAVGVSNRTEEQDHELASCRPIGWHAA